MEASPNQVVSSSFGVMVFYAVSSDAFSNLTTSFRIDDGYLYRQTAGGGQGFDDPTLVRQQELFGTFDAGEEGDGHLLLIALQEDGRSVQHVWFENETYFIHMTCIVDIDHDG